MTICDMCKNGGLSVNSYELMIVNGGPNTKEYLMADRKDFCRSCIDKLVIRIKNVLHDATNPPQQMKK